MSRDCKDAMDEQRQYVMMLLGSVTGQIDTTTSGNLPLDEDKNSIPDYKRKVDYDDNESNQYQDKKLCALSAVLDDVDETSTTSCKDDVLGGINSQENTKTVGDSAMDAESDSSDNSSDSISVGSKEYDTEILSASNTRCDSTENLSHKVRSTALHENTSEISEPIEDLLKRAREFSSKKVELAKTMLEKLPENKYENKHCRENKNRSELIEDTATETSHRNSIGKYSGKYRYGPNDTCETKTKRIALKQSYDADSSIPQTAASLHDDHVSRCDVPVANTSEYDFSSPTMLVDYSKYFKGKQHYTKGCKWSGNGNQLLVMSSDQKFRLLDLPAELSAPNLTEVPAGGFKAPKPSLVVTEGELVYDYQWFPSSSDCHSAEGHATYSFACCCRGLPVHLWSAVTGELVCSYKPYNLQDELAPALSLGFSRDGTKLVCGFNKSIRIFQTARPGRTFDTICAKRQNGIISCFDFHPHLHHVMAAGSYLKGIGLYNLNSGKMFAILEGQRGGLTQLRFSSDGLRLYTAARKDNELLCWDIRNMGNVLNSHQRLVDTQQRISFSLSSDDRTLVSGSTDGHVHTWDVDPDRSNESRRPPARFLAADDCVNGVSLHPSRAILATSSGQRRRSPHPDDHDEDDSDEVDHLTLTRHSSVKLWCGGAAARC